MLRLGRRGMFFRAVSCHAVSFRAVPCCFVLGRAMPYHVVAGGVVARCVFSCRAARSAACGERSVFAQAVRGPDGKRAGRCGARVPCGEYGCCAAVRVVRARPEGADAARKRAGCRAGRAVLSVVRLCTGWRARPEGEWFRTGRAEGPRLRMSVIFIIFATVCRREVYGGGVS